MATPRCPAGAIRIGSPHASASRPSSHASRHRTERALRLRLLLAIALLACAGLVVLVRAGLLQIPPYANPWAPIDVAEPPGLLTRWKLMRLSADDALCQSVLARTALRYERLEDRVTGAGCGFRNAVRITATSVRLSEPFSASCRLAVSLALWERHVVQPAAQARFGQPVVRLEHFGSYACRNVAGRAGGRRSQHATADALDVAGFAFADGRRVTVARDWRGEGAAAAFLHEVRDGACPLFGSVLGPDYNTAHRDHLHLDRGRFGICR